MKKMSDNKMFSFGIKIGYKLGMLQYVFDSESREGLEKKANFIHEIQNLFQNVMNIKIEFYESFNAFACHILEISQFKDESLSSGILLMIGAVETIGANYPEYTSDTKNAVISVAQEKINLALSEYLTPDRIASLQDDLSKRVWDSFVDEKSLIQLFDQYLHFLSGQNDKPKIFISYRREGGEYFARILSDYLSQSGFPVFYDIENMRTGKFNEQILDRIAQSDCVVVILPPSALDRCQSPEDWVRKEIAESIRRKKKIIPVMLRGFVFPQNLPEDIMEIKNYHGLEANNELFEAFFAKLVVMVTEKN